MSSKVNASVRPRSSTARVCGCGRGPIIGGSVGPHRRQRAVELLHLDQHVRAGATAGQRRGADVVGQHVRIAVHAHRIRVGGIGRVVPRAGRQLHDIGAQRRRRSTTPARHAPRSLNTRTTSPSASPRCGRIARMHPDRFAPLNFRGLAGRDRRRAGCAAGWPAGWPAGAAGKSPRAAPPSHSSGSNHCRVARAVGVAEPVDVVGEDLDAAARRARRCA